MSHQACGSKQSVDVFQERLPEWTIDIEVTQGNEKKKKN